MGLTYFKRYRMEIGLGHAALAQPTLLSGYRLLPWDSQMLWAHAEAKYRSFRSEIDANVFPCLGDYEGCLRLMGEISRKDGFEPRATWLLAYEPASDLSGAGDILGGAQGVAYVGTIQGILDRSGMGAVQNLGIAPEHRGRGLGSCLLLRCLEGFREAGLRRVFLEVTAQNDSALRLYRRLGFAKARTVYKAVEVAYSRASD